MTNDNGFMLGVKNNKRFSVDNQEKIVNNKLLKNISSNTLKKNLEEYLNYFEQIVVTNYEQREEYVDKYIQWWKDKGAFNSYSYVLENGEVVSKD